MRYLRCAECGRTWREEVPLNYGGCPFCGARADFEVGRGEDLPREKDILKYLADRRGTASNDEMYRERFGDVGRGWDTILRLKKLADEGKVGREIQHVFQGGRCVRTIIRWTLRPPTAR